MQLFRNWLNPEFAIPKCSLSNSHLCFGPFLMGSEIRNDGMNSALPELVHVFGSHRLLPANFYDHTFPDLNAVW